MYDGSEHSDEGEHVRVLYSIKLCFDNLGGTCLGVINLVLTYESSVILDKIFWVVNEVVWVIVVDSNDN